MDPYQYVLSFLLNLVEMYLLYLIAATMTPSVKAPWWKLGLFLVTDAASIFFTRYFLKPDALGIVMCLAGTILLLLLFFGFRPANIAAFAIHCTISFLSESVVALTMMLAGADIQSLVLDSTALTVVAVVSSRVIQIILTYLVIRRLKPELDRMIASLTRFILFGMIVVFLMLVCFLLVYMWALENVPIPDWFLFLYMLCAILFILVALITQSIAVRNIREREERKLIDLQAELSREVHRSLEQLREYEHDYRKHLQTILALTHQGMRKEAEAYYDELITEFDRTHMATIKNMPALSAVIQRYKTQAEHNAVRFIAEIPSDLETVVSELHLCVVLSNLLDNAVEASGNAAPVREVFLAVRPGRNGQPITILAENTFVYEKGKLVFTRGLPATTKPDRDLHGYGLRSVSRIVRQYGGKLDITIQEAEGRFKVSITI